MSPFGDAYRGRCVLVTGHTGFKGSWLCVWLAQLGARVVGFGHAPPTEPSHFAACRLAGRMADVRGDVRDPAALARVVAEHRPDVVFHLAAQALVRPGYEDPRGTFETNLMGTVNVLEAARACPAVRAVVCVTTDKVYENREWPWGYRETDRLGGHDPYSASKACAELAVAVYQRPTFQRRVGREAPLAISSARAGNVIGGGDWARDRLVPDVVRAAAAGRDVVIRSPQAVRPWQHVLESLGGYLWLAARMLREPGAHTAAYNFGPDGGATVAAVVRAVLDQWPGTPSQLVIEPDRSGAEAGLLRLDCSRAAADLGWRPTWDLATTLRQTVAWYRGFYQDPAADAFARSAAQIDEYVNTARENGVVWAS